jgi:hypothetical protein
MPSLQRVMTIVSSSDDKQLEEKVISEVTEVANETSAVVKPIEASTDLQLNFSEPTSTKNSKNCSKAKKIDVPANQRTIGSFFTKPKPQEKKVTPSVTATPSKLDSNNATKATPRSAPTANKSESNELKSSANVTRNVAVTPSTSAKKEKPIDSVAGIDDDIMAIVLGSHGANSNTSSNITPRTKPRSKVRGLSVTSMLPTLIVQELKADSLAVNAPAETSRVDRSSVLENVGLSPKDKETEGESDVIAEQVNLLKPRSKKAPQKREAVTEEVNEGTLAVNAGTLSPSEGTECNSVSMEQHDASSIVDASDVISNASKPVKVNKLAARKKQKLDDQGHMPTDSTIPDTSTTKPNEIEKDCNNTEASQNTRVATGKDDNKSSDVLLKESIVSTEQSIELSEEDQALLSKFEKMSKKYISRAKELVGRSMDGSLEEESFQKDARDRSIIIPDEVNSYPIASTNEVDDDWLHCLSLLIQGR